MPRYIAFLRAINVGGHTVTMPRLKALFEELDLEEVETFIASGNVLFNSKAKPATLEPRIEKPLHAKLGYEVHTFIRSVAEVSAAAAHVPFPNAGPLVEGSLIVGFLRDAPPADVAKAIHALRTETDELQVHGREIYWRVIGRQSDSTLSNSLFEKTLKGRATFRNVNTVTRIAARCPPSKEAPGREKKAKKK